MKSNYKRLGDYIRQVDVRNRELAVEKLVGLTINKAFITSVANTIGTDLSKYKVISKDQFACSLMQVSRDGKMPVAIFKENKAIMSPAYPVFEVYRPDELMPDFLMMWFSRSEFDRQAAFYAVGGVRGSLTWEDFCDLTLPIPPIEEQRKIVSEYQAIEQRIENNRRLIATLEATAQTIYSKMFVEDIDPENFPEGWRMGTIGDLFELQRGFDLPTQDRSDGSYPIYASTGITGYHCEYKIEPPCVVTGRSGSIGEVFYADGKCWPLNTTLWVKDFKGTSPFFVYYKLKELELSKTIAGFAAVPTLNRNDVHMMVSSIPPKGLFIEFENEIKTVYNHKKTIKSECEILTEVQSLLLARMG